LQADRISTFPKNRSVKWVKLQTMGKANEAVLNQQQSREIELREFIPAEVTLETIGFFTPSSKRLKYEIKEMTFGYRNSLGETETTKVEIVPNVKVGLPITVDLDYYRAFQKVLYEFLQVGGDLNDPIPFTTRQLIRYAGKAYGKYERDNVRTWLERMVGTTISCQMYNHKTKGYVKLDGPPFSQVMAKGDDLGNGTIAESNYVWLAPYYKKTFAAGYLRPVDLEFHKSLDKNISKHLYPILETGFHASGDTVYRKSYHDLCDDLKLIEHEQVSLVRRQLDPSFRELRDKEYVSTWSYRQAAKKDDFVVTAEPGKRYLANKQEQLERRDRWLALKRQGEQSDEQTLSVQEQLLEEIIRVCGGSKTDFAYAKLIRTETSELLRTALSETRLAAHQGTIKKSKRQYFFWMTKQIKADRENALKQVKS
jgi:hypothetical protein